MSYFTAGVSETQQEKQVNSSKAIFIGLRQEIDYQAHKRAQEPKLYIILGCIRVTRQTAWESLP